MILSIINFIGLKNIFLILLCFCCFLCGFYFCHVHYSLEIDKYKIEAENKALELSNSILSATLEAMFDKDFKYEIWHAI